MDDYDNLRKPLLSESGRYKLYTDSTDSSINVNVEIQKPGSGVTFRKHITLFGAIGILTGINFRIHSWFRIGNERVSVRQLKTCIPMQLSSAYASVADPGFPKRGAPTLKVGGSTY